MAFEDNGDDPKELNFDGDAAAFYRDDNAEDDARNKGFRLD